MGGKSSTTSQTVEIPPEVREQYKHLIASGNQLAQKPFQAYSQDPTAFVAPLTATQQAGIANINAMQGMAQPSIEQGQNMIMQGIGAGAPLQYQSLDTAAQGRGMGTALFGESLGTAAAGTGAAGDIFGQALPAIQQAVETGAGYGAAADPYLRSALGAAAPLMGQGATLTNAGLGAGAGFGAMAADYLGKGTQAVSPTQFSGEQIDKYMSPYLKNVVEAQQALQQEEAAAQRSALKGQAIAAGAFGGDRGGIAQANLARQQSLANQATLANLLQGGYGQALGAFQQQQGVNLAAEQANRQAQQFGSQQAAALGQQLFGQNLAAGSQLANIGQALFGQNIGQGQALAGLGQQLYAQGLGGAQAAAGIGSNIAAMKAQEAALQQQAAQGVFGQAAQEAALQQAAAQNLYNMGSQGGMNIANLGVAGQTAALQGAQAQLSAGQIEQQTEQAAKSAMYNQFLQQQAYPFQTLGFLGNLSMGIGSQSGGTTTTQQGSYSDRRLKEDVRKVGETFDGQPIYSFKYKGEEKSQLGLIAQEVEKSHPEAVGERNGYLTVDYEDATDDAAKRGHFATGGLVPSRLGGAVMEPGDYARGGYAEGGWTQQPRNEEDPGAPQGWVNEKTGEVKYGSDPNIAEAAEAEKKDAGFTGDPRIKDLYQKYMFRDPDATGGDYWQKALESGTPIEDIEAGIANSRERQVVNQKPMTYNAANFGTPAAPVQNRYGFYAAPSSSSGSSFTPEAIAARQQASAPATGKGPATSSYTPPARYGAYTPPAATGKGPSTSSYTPAPSYSSPAATGKGPSTNAYTGSNYTGYSGSPTASGKGPSTRAYASGGRVPFATGGAGDLKDYIDMMSGSPKGLAMAHAGIFKIPGERADITKYIQGASRGSNIPQPGRIPEQRNFIKEAADTGTNIAKLAQFGSAAKEKLEKMMTPDETKTGSTTTVTKTPAGGATPKMSEAPSGTNVAEYGGGEGNITDAVKNAGSKFSFNAPTEDSFTPPDLPVNVASLDVGNLFLATGGRVHKQFAGGVFGKQEDQGSSDPAEGVYSPVGPGLDIEFDPKTGGGSFVKDATQRLLKGGSGGTSSGGGSLLGTLGQAVSLGTAAFKVGATIAEFLPMIFSDERLKKNAKPIGRLYDGQTVYRFDMDGKTQIGLIAQEVEKKVPEAVGLAGKYKAVDYEMATAKAAKRGHFDDGGVAVRREISSAPDEGEIKVASVSPSDAMTLSDAEFKGDTAPASAPVAEVRAGLSPDAPTGVKPPDDRHADVFDRMLNNESRRQQFDKEGKTLVSSSGAEGISQIKPAAAQEAAAYLGETYDPDRVRTDKDYNMKLGKAYFNMQLDRFGGDPMIAAAAYNAGPGRVEEALRFAKEKGGDFLDYLPKVTVQYLANLSDAAQGAHQQLLKRQEQVEAKASEGEGPKVVDAAKPATGLAPAAETKPAAGPGLGAALGKKNDWEVIGTKILPDQVPKSADFWVPLIAAVGGMLGARAPTLGGAIGAGLSAGAGAYMSQREMEERIAATQAQRDIQRQQLGLNERELKLKEEMEQRRRKAAETAAQIIQSDIAPAAVTPAVKTNTIPSAPAVAPAGGAAGAGAAAGAPAEEGERKPATGATPVVKLPPIPAPNSDFWKNVHPESNPYILADRASKYDRAAAMASESPEIMKVYQEQAKSARESAFKVRDSGKVMLLDGTTVNMPGFVESQAALEDARERARKKVELDYTARVTPEGGKVIIPPEAVAAAAGTPSTTTAPPAAPAERPNTATFDNKTGKLKTAIPAAPAGGGFSPLTAPPGAIVTEQSETNKELVKNDSNFQKDFLEKLPKTDDAIARYKAMANAFKLTEAGYANEAAAQWAAFAKSFGMNDLAARISSGEPEATQLILKNAPMMVLETLSAANPRFAQSEFLTLKDQSTPSPDKLPRTNFEIVRDGLAMLERQKAFARDWQEAQKEGWRSPSAFWAAWSDANPMSRFKEAAGRQAGNFKGMDLPAATEWTPGAIYVAPSRLEPRQAESLAKRGVQPGQLFRFNGWDSERSIVPIPKGKGFEAYLE